MNPIQYTILVQRTLLFLFGGAFFAIAAILSLVDPSQGVGVLTVMLLVVFIFISSVFALASFWWFFSIKKLVLTTNQVNKILGQSVVNSGIIVSLLALNQTGQLDLWSGLILLVCYVFYQIWINSE